MNRGVIPKEKADSQSNVELLEGKKDSYSENKNTPLVQVKCFLFITSLT